MDEKSFFYETTFDWYTEFNTRLAQGHKFLPSDIPSGIFGFCDLTDETWHGLDLVKFKQQHTKLPKSLSIGMTKLRQGAYIKGIQREIRDTKKELLRLQKELNKEQLKLQAELKGVDTD